ncbi:MAG: DUF2142 domain-containing protein, partial [Candidatus Roizmanbacteria bacterium]|nr:DUF2142 domain-containing protein [Candidatus Roizmanbacteria bacterium]
EKTTVMPVEAYCRFPLISYMPQVVGVYLGLLFSLNPYITFFLGRAMLFIVSLIWIEQLIKSSPKLLKQWYILVCCLPLFMHQATSYGYDAIPVLLFFTFFSHIWIMTTTQNLSIREWIIASVLVLLFLLSRRGGYEPLGLLLFLPLVPASSKQRLAQWWVGVLALVGAALYMALLATNYASYGSSGMPLGANPPEQLAVLLQHPLTIPTLLANTVLAKGWFYLLSTVGTLGMLEYRISAGVYALYAVYAAAVIIRSKKERTVTRPIRYYLLGTVLLEILYLMLILYVTWTTVGNPVVEGIQGRYFWPLIPLIGILLVQIRPGKTRTINIPIYVPVVLLISAGASIAYTIIQRYFL